MKIINLTAVYCYGLLPPNEILVRIIFSEESIKRGEKRRVSPPLNDISFRLVFAGRLKLPCTTLDEPTTGFTRRL